MNPDPRLEAMKQQLLGAQRTLSAMPPSATAVTQQVAQTNQPAQTQPQGVEAFNVAIQGLLKQYQGLGTKPFVQQSLNAQQAQNQRVQQTDPGLIGAAPGLQNSVRSAAAGAVEPTIQAADSSAQTFREQLNSFGDVIQQARQFSQDYEAKQAASKQEARQTLLLAVQLGGADGLDSIKKENPNIFKIAGLDEETLIMSAKAQQKKEEESKKTYATVDLGDRIAVMDNKGNIIRTIAKGKLPSDSGGLTYSQQKDLEEKTKAKSDLLNLLGQYRTALAGSNTFSRIGDPNKVTQLNSLRNQITAIYKKEQQLGTLDAGVQKLIEGIIPGGGFNISQLSTQAQLDAIDNFVENQGGTTGGTSGTTSSGLKYQIIKQHGENPI